MIVYWNNSRMVIIIRLLLLSNFFIQQKSAYEILLSLVGSEMGINAGPYTPWVYRPDISNEDVTLLFPGLSGGPNWGGVAHNPNNGYVYVFAADIGTLGWLENAGPDSEIPYVLTGPGLRTGSFSVRINGMNMPCQKPPWGRLTAVDTNLSLIHI